MKTEKEIRRMRDHIQDVRHEMNLTGECYEDPVRHSNLIAQKAILTWVLCEWENVDTPKERTKS